jgi:hypothetical protein
MKLSALTLLFLISCGGSRPDEETAPEEVLVQNDNWQDMTIFVVSVSGLSRRIGSAGSLGLTVLEIPGDIPQGSLIRLVADPVGSEEVFTTGDIPVTGTQVIFLRISSHLSHSSWTIDDVARDEE